MPKFVKYVLDFSHFELLSYLNRFKVSLPFRPYFYIHIKTEAMQETMAYLGKKYNGPVTAMEVVKKEDLVSQISTG